MAKNQSDQVRDDNLRLVLSTQEADYIANRLRDASKGMRANAIAGGIGLLLAVGFFGVFYNVFWNAVWGPVKSMTGFAAAVCAIIGVYGIIRAIDCGLNVLRYKSYATDHEKFLKRFHRQR